MRILWFANTPCGAAEKIDPNFVRGGWLNSLEKELSKVKSIELGVAFYVNENMKPFIYKNVQYFPVKRIGNNKLSRVLLRLKNKIEYDENLGKFIGIVKEFKPNVVHIHGTESPFGLVQKLDGLKTVVSVQGNLTVVSNFFFRGISKVKILKILGLRAFMLSSSPYATFQQLKKKSKYEREILFEAENIIGRTDWDKSITTVLAPKARYFQGQELLRESFYQQKWPEESFENRILYSISGENWYKGVGTVFEISLLLTKLNFRFRWRVAGVNNNSLIVKTFEKIHKVKANEVGVEFLGNRDEVELVADLLDSSIFIQTSHIENSPNSLCEAMILGMPIVASMAGGTQTLLRNNKDGMLVQDGDAYAFAGTIVNLFHDKERAVDMASCAKAFAEKRHNQEEIVSALVKTYQCIDNGNS